LPIAGVQQYRVLQAHQRLYTKTDGLIGHQLLVPCLLMRTTGRRSCLIRTDALTYGSNGNTYLVVASNGGSDQAPTWLANLRAEPNREVRIGRRRSKATARAPLPDDTDRRA
jgi:deazaflavin-dependent oxidoreductase (nitroreductase family)